MTLHRKDELIAKIDGLFSCQLCDFKTSMKSYFQNHRLHHDSDALNKCKYCHYRAKTKTAVIHHQNKMHRELMEKNKSELEPGTCQICGKTYAHSGILKRHIKEVHLKDKASILCMMCDFQTTRSNTFKSHTAKHLDWS